MKRDAPQKRTCAVVCILAGVALLAGMLYVCPTIAPGKEYQETALSQAVKDECSVKEFARRLHTAQPNDWKALKAIAERDRADLAKVLAPRMTRSESIWHGAWTAVICNHHRTLDVILETGLLKPDELGSLLFDAVTMGFVPTTEVLLSHGADVNKKNGEGETPLHIAVSNRRLGMVKLLLSYGAAPHKPDAEGKTSMEIARDTGWVEGVEAMDELTEGE